MEILFCRLHCGSFVLWTVYCGNFVLRSRNCTIIVLRKWPLWATVLPSLSNTNFAVQNLSSITFLDTELSLVDKGLSFAPTQSLTYTEQQLVITVFLINSLNL